MGKFKDDYIKEFGKEAWSILSHNKAEYDKARNNYRLDEKRAEARLYYWNNKEKIHQKYLENKEKVRMKNKHYNETHKESISENKKKYYAENVEKKKGYNKAYRNTMEGKALHMALDYKREDRINNRNGFSLTREWILNNIFTSKCIYCGDSDWKHLGCDRISNEKPHTEDNCICACGICNIERQQKRMSVEEFIEYRKTNPRDVPRTHQQVVEINGKKVIKKVN